METYPVYPQVQQSAETEQTFDVRKFLYRCVDAWPWFVISVIICLGLGYFYYLRQTPKYKRSADVLIVYRGNYNSNLTSQISMLGMGGQMPDVDNEVIVFKSISLMYDAVRQLGLNTSYSVPGRFHDNSVYGPEVPYLVEFADGEQKSASLAIIPQAGGKLLLTDFIGNEGKQTKRLDYEITVTPGMKTIATPVGEIKVYPNAAFVKKPDTKPYEKIMVRHIPLMAAAEQYEAALAANHDEKMATIITLVVSDTNPLRADALLNALLEAYNRANEADKHLETDATAKFIRERLAVIENELSSVDSDISQYKSAHLIPDPSSAASAAVARTDREDQRVIELQNQLQVAKYVRDYMANPSYADDLIPVITGIGDTGLEQQISLYNSQLLAYRDLARSSSDKNPVVTDLATRLQNMRAAIVNGVDQQIGSLGTLLKSANKQLDRQTGIMAGAPEEEKYLVSVSRQQKVKESLYLYLLQKLEESEVSAAFTPHNIRVINPPMGNPVPYAPNRNTILGIALLIGLLIPAGICALLEWTDNRIHHRKDFDAIDIPFAGEIPHLGKNPGHFAKVIDLVRGKHKESAGVPKIVVADGCRDVTNEAFRVIRSNIEFMLTADHQTPVVMITSFNPGSGKSYVSGNLAAVFGLKGKKVLLIDGDMRHGSLSRTIGSPLQGLASALSGNLDDWHKALRKPTGMKNVEVLPAGSLPPNPSELLDDPAFARLLDEARKEFDIILIDCPPLNVVVDAQIISRLADNSVFVARAGLFHRTDIAQLGRIKTENVLPRVCLVLNDTKTHGRIGYYGETSYTHHNYYNYYSTKK